MRIALIGGAYTARSVIAECQRSLNLYPEHNPQDAPVPVTHYPTPGLRLLGTAPVAGEVRGLYCLSNGYRMIAVVGFKVYLVGTVSPPSTPFVLLGTIGTNTGQVSMIDNGSTMVLVDGTNQGYTVDVNTFAFGTISSAAWYGANMAAYLDTFLLFNKPFTPQFYSSNSNAVTFDPLYFANKTGFSDPLVGIAVVHREIWLIGQMTTEIWYNAGGSAFPFQIMPGSFIQQGCVAPRSIAQADESVFWLSQNAQGGLIVLQGAGYQVKRISTHAIESALASYVYYASAIGFCYQQLGHLFYVLTFPYDDKTWVYDVATGLWHERAWVDNNGVEHRHRANCHAYYDGFNIVGDWQNGNIYALDPTVFTDNGQPIKRVRAFPHLLQDGKRVVYREFIADMEVGTDTNSADTPTVNLSWSDTRGETWSNPVSGSLGQTGQYLTSIQWQRLGMARDRVFRLDWTASVQTALNGAFLTAEPCAS
jgi:hypothetical protein